VAALGDSNLAGWRRTREMRRRTGETPKAGRHGDSRRGGIDSQRRGVAVPDWGGACPGIGRTPECSYRGPESGTPPESEHIDPRIALPDVSSNPAASRTVAQLTSPAGVLIAVQVPVTEIFQGWAAGSGQITGIRQLWVGDLFQQFQFPSHHV